MSRLVGESGMKIIIALALVIYAFTARAQLLGYTDYFITGNKLHEWCVPPQVASQKEGKALCRGYVVAGYDYLVFEMRARQKRQVCVPRAITPQQLVDVVTKYLVERPKQRHSPAAALVVAAMRKAWPCP